REKKFTAEEAAKAEAEADAIVEAEVEAAPEAASAPADEAATSNVSARPSEPKRQIDPRFAGWPHINSANDKY
ncbi:MAG TPA: hypothetical protein VFH43_06345, partial [Candidatus Kapabacteria bacterium]|nr:hypothetical protein [Candidatus Kapabacteria bacterium]